MNLLVLKKNATLRFGCLLLALAQLLSFACSAPQHSTGQPGNGSFPRIVRLEDGSETQIQHKPERIISLTLSTDEILCALVDEKRIAGLSKFSQDDATSYVSDNARRVNVFIDRNAEQIVSLRPDLVLAARYSKIDLKNLLAQTKVPIITTTNFRTFAEIEANIRLIAKAVGEESRADSVIADMKQKIAGSRSRLLPARAGLRVMYLAPGNFTAGSDTIMHDILLGAGLRDAAAEGGINGHIKTASEQIAQINPDVILIGFGYDRDRGFRQLLENDKQLSTVRAVKDRRIIEVPARCLLTVSHHAADAVETIVEAINKIPTIEGGNHQ